MHILKHTHLLVLAPLLLACGSEDPSKNREDGGSTSNEPLLPWATGHRWTYQVTQGTEVTTKETIVGEEEAVGGSGPFSETLALKVVTTKQNGTDETVSWQSLDGNRVIRHRELSFSAATDELELEEHWDPYKLHIDWRPEH